MYTIQLHFVYLGGGIITIKVFVQMIPRLRLRQPNGDDSTNEMVEAGTGGWPIQKKLLGEDMTYFHTKTK